MQKIKKYIKLSINYLKMLGLFHGLRKIFFDSIYKKITDSTISSYAYKKSSYQYIKRFYSKHNIIEYKFSCPPDVGIDSNETIYWTCWLQGMEHAPDLVKCCYNSAKHYSGGHKIIVITYENMDSFIKLPEYIIKKHLAGFITPVQLSDILRTYLLYTYGGVWFDSTVLFTNEIPKKLLNQALFFFRMDLNDIYCPVSSWFIIASERHNLLLYRQLCILCEYWKNKKSLIDYFIFHYFLNVIIENDIQCKKQFEMMTYYNNQTPHYLQLKLFFSQFNPETWENIKNISFCHKLTYKVDDRMKDMDNTYYRHILELYVDAKNE